MKRFSLCFLIVLLIAGIPVYAQDGTKTYSGQGISLEYPDTWFLFEKENGLGITNLAQDSEPDVTTVAPGEVTVRVLLLNDYEQITLEENSPDFVLGYFASLYSQGYLWPELLTAQLSGVDMDQVQLIINVSESEIVSSDDESILMVRQTVDFVDSAEFAVMLVNGSIVVAASAPNGELDQSLDSIIQIARSIELANAAG